MDDRELLELAAKAAGIDGAYRVWYPGNEPIVTVSVGIQSGDGFSLWNPLVDDGDALRLAVKLNIIVHPGFAYTPTGKLINYRDHANRIAATRRAIVRAAAEIGRAM